MEDSIKMPTSIKPAFTKNNLAIVFSTDSNYVPYMAVSIQSIIDNSDKNYNYDILVFDDGITTYQKEQLSQMLKSNVSLRYIDVKPLLVTMDSSLFKSRGIWSAAACYRLFIPQLMSDYDKVLYLDCDVLVKDSLVDLFKIDLGKAEAGCCYDELHYSAHSDRIKDIAEYVKIKDWNKYFNSGVILFNIKNINSQKFIDGFIKALKRPYLPFLDQDVLNILWEGKYVPLDWSWNFQYYMVIEHPELLDNSEISKASSKRRIIHYITGHKPWNSPDLPYAAEWWLAARKTAFYEEIIYKNTRISNLLLRNFKHYNRLLSKYVFYKILKNISFGKIKNHFAQQSSKLKQQVKQIRAIYKDK